MFPILRDAQSVSSLLTSRKEAEKQLKALGLTLRTEGMQDRITGQIPAAGQSVPGGSQVLAYLGETPEKSTVKVPDFSGMTRQQASDAAGQLGLYILVTGNQDVSHSVVVTEQSIPAGEQVQAGTTIKLKFTDTTIRD